MFKRSVRVLALGFLFYGGLASAAKIEHEINCRSPYPFPWFFPEEVAKTAGFESKPKNEGYEVVIYSMFGRRADLADEKQTIVRASLLLYTDDAVVELASWPVLYTPESPDPAGKTARFHSLDGSFDLEGLEHSKSGQAKAKLRASYSQDGKSVKKDLEMSCVYLPVYYGAPRPAEEK